MADAAKSVPSRRKSVGISAIQAGGQPKRFDKPQAIALVIGLISGFMLVPGAGDALSALSYIYYIIAILWGTVASIGSIAAFFVESDDETLVGWAAYGGFLGGLMSVLFRFHHPYNYFLTVLVQLLAAAAGALLRLALWLILGGLPS